MNPLENKTLTSNLIDLVQTAERDLGQFLKSQQVDARGNGPLTTTLGAAKFL